MPNNNRIHVVIASDHPIFRDGLRQVLEAEGRLVLVGEACGSEEALRTVRKLKPDIVLLDVAVAPSTNRELLKGLASFPAVRTILLNGVFERDLILELLHLGVRGIISKEVPVDVLVRCLLSVMAGQYWIGRESVDGIVQALQTLALQPEQPAKVHKFGITSRELEIVAAVAVGHSNKEIAEKLSLSEQTVKHHLTSIFDKLGVSGRLELAVFAANHRLLSED